MAPRKTYYDDDGNVIRGRGNVKDNDAQIQLALAGLEKVHERMKGEEKNVLNAVLEARKLGASWADIAKGLKVSRQAAWQKYKNAGDIEEEDDDE